MWLDERSGMENPGAGTKGDVERLISDLRALSGDINSCAVLSEEGKLISSSREPGVERERVSAMLAALSSIAKRTAREHGKDHVSQLRIKTDNGHLLMVRFDGGGALAATTGPEARVGLALYDMRNARSGIEQAMGEGE
jgi:predicted regulator of Ras-like GTPase activity (Roadblock/LC7/MglB family)